MKTEHSYDGNGVLLDTLKDYIFVETYSKLHRNDPRPLTDIFVIGQVNAISRWDFMDMIEDYNKARTPKVEFDTLAVAVLEDKPVFEGDRLYHMESGEAYVVEKGGAKLLGFQSIGDPHNCINPNDFSTYLTFAEPAPKRTFQLNGLDLPCPDTKGQANSDPHELIIGSRKQGYACEYFNEFVFSGDQSFEVFKAIRDVLLKARDQ